MNQRAAIRKTGASRKTTDIKSARSRKSDDDAKLPASNGKSLIIVESPTKARTLGKYLGDLWLNDQDGSSGSGAPEQFIVIASGGHIRDLPEKSLGVDITRNFQPDYQILPGKTAIANQLRGAARTAKRIYIATDPDREGEAIAWHIKEILDSDLSERVHRIQFHEITRNAVREALRAPGVIDRLKVEAQQARRILDRLVGYQVSPLLWKTITGGLSAGRVQSVALRLICEREAEIEAFVAVEYWTIDGLFKCGDKEPFWAQLNKVDGKKPEIPDKAACDSLLTRINKSAFSITEVKRSRKKRTPPPPYTTSTLQQDAGRRLGFPVKRTMQIAQRLFEGVELGNRGTVGLITYMRTDSTRIADEAAEALRNWISANFPPEYLAKTRRVYKNKKGAVQDAHEAIRPTDISITLSEAKAHLQPQEFKLYELIWKRFAATQMSEAQFDHTAVTITDGIGIEFRATGQIMLFPGWLTVYGETPVEENGDKEESLPKLPVGLEAGLTADLNELKSEQHFTQPPPRFSEASLVKTLDELGIGRPSTYAIIIATLLDRKYVVKDEKVLKPAELGRTVNSILVDWFPGIFNVEFTAKMEGDLDRIETGAAWVPVVQEFYGSFSEALKAAEAVSRDIKRDKVLQKVGRECPQCGGALVYRWGKKGKFISCSHFPRCKYAENITHRGEKSAPVETDHACPNCGKKMVIREGRFGKFLGCSDYPKCRGILTISSGHKCPREGCVGELVQRRGRKGGNFYGCNQYPQCDFITWNEPMDGPCPQCGAPTIFMKKSNRNGDEVKCERCNWSKSAAE